MENEVNRYTVHFFWKKIPKNGTFAPFGCRALPDEIHMLSLRKHPKPPGSTRGRLAQLGERGVRNAEVGGSSPLPSTIPFP